MPGEAFVAYEVIQHGLRLLGPAWAPEPLQRLAEVVRTLAVPAGVVH